MGRRIRIVAACALATRKFVPKAIAAKETIATLRNLDYSEFLLEDLVFHHVHDSITDLVEGCDLHWRHLMQ